MKTKHLIEICAVLVTTEPIARSAKFQNLVKSSLCDKMADHGITVAIITPYWKEE